MHNYARLLSCMVHQPHFSAPPADLTGKTVLVTGPTQGGIGYTTALELSERGAHVILAGRDHQRTGEAAAAIAAAQAGASVSTLSLDLASLASVRGALGALAGRGARVDVLVCNAGAQTAHALPAGREPQQQQQQGDAAAMAEVGSSDPFDGVESAFAACALGHHALVAGLRARRVVWVTGDAYVLARAPPAPFLTAGSAMERYARACVARLWLGAELQRRGYEGSGNERGGEGEVEVAVVHPGVIATNFAKLSTLGLWAARQVLLDHVAGAQAVVFTASVPERELRRVRGDGALAYYHNKFGWMTEFDAADWAADGEAARRLFDECDRLCTGLERGL